MVSIFEFCIFENIFEKFPDDLLTIEHVCAHGYSDEESDLYQLDQSFLIFSEERRARARICYESLCQSKSMLQAKVRENSTPDVAGKIRQILNDMAHF